VPVTYFYDEHDSKDGRDTENILFKDPHFGIRLLRAYVRLPRLQQQRLVGLVEAMAQGGEAAQ
jgi:hypothetical protein